eukprot:TRINITY_DN3676_c0_g1_i1.p1 TRINITY_DN3676_c0_g1~~TRINITY_DN3676_c0_g1_i1.p1  ORF type:complete len:244 (-),score=39.99 TRINITY_DN3676_c0_g1_i1:102-833(-)
MLYDELYYVQMACLLEAGEMALCAHTPSLLPLFVAPPPGLQAPPGLASSLEPMKVKAQMMEPASCRSGTTGGPYKVGYTFCAKSKRRSEKNLDLDFESLTETPSDSASTWLEAGTASETSTTCDEFASAPRVPAPFVASESSTTCDESASAPPVPAPFVASETSTTCDESASAPPVPAPKEMRDQERQVCYFQNRFYHKKEGDAFEACSLGDQCRHCHNHHRLIKRRNHKTARCTCPIKNVES